MVIGTVNLIAALNGLGVAGRLTGSILTASLSAPVALIAAAGAGLVYLANKYKQAKETELSAVQQSAAKPDLTPYTAEMDRLVCLHEQPLLRQHAKRAE